MEVIVRVPLFYVLDNTLNDILSPHPSSCSSITNQPDSCLAEKVCSNSVKINPLYLIIISSCLILVTTPLKNMVRFAKYLLLLLLWCSLNLDAHSSVTLSNPSAMALRVTICVIVFYCLYQQLDVELRATTSAYWILKYSIPSTLWLWTLHYLNDECNVVLSPYSLMTLRFATFFIASFVMFEIEQEFPEENNVLEVAIVFFLFTFGLRTAEFQFKKYWRLIDIMRNIFQKNGEIGSGKLEYSFIGLTFFIIQLSSLNNSFPRTLSGLTEWNFFKEICNIESVTILKYLILRKILLYFNKSILKAVQRNLLQNYTSEILMGDPFISPLTCFMFAIDSQFLNSNAESRWNIITMCFLVNCGAILSNICDLVIIQEGNKPHYKLLGLCLFTFIGAILLLGFSLWTIVPLGTHLYIVLSYSISVIVMMPLAVLRYILEDVAPYNESVEAPHRASLISMVILVFQYCLTVSLVATLYLISTQEDFCVHVFSGAVIFGSYMHKHLKVKYSRLVNYWQMRTFIFWVREAKPEALKELNDVCSICRGDMMVSGFVTVCRHYFHKHCLLLWLDKSNRCPMCQNCLYAQYQAD